jgi:glycosyltransferase involved in cell wall biosynthesis
MRILMLNNEYPPLGGGTGTVNQAVLERLARHANLGGERLEIDLITSAEGDRPERTSLSEGIRIHRLPVNRWNIHHASNSELLVYTLKATQLALQLHAAKPYNLCMAWSAVPAGGVALALRRLAGLPYLVRVCGPDIPGFEQRYGHLYVILTPVIKAIWHSARVVVAKCSEEARMIHAISPDVPVTLVPNGVDLTAFQPADLLKVGTSLRLLCVARLIERKGQHHLIEAVGKMREQGCDVTLDLIGTGDTLEALQTQTRDLGLSDRVNFLGYIPRHEIGAHYSAAHVFVLPSYNEGMSVAALEAMASGLPLLLSRSGGSGGLVAEGVNGFTFDWGEIDTLTGTLLRLDQDRSLLANMGKASRRRAGLYSWDNAARNYLDMFVQLTSSPVVVGAERTL